MVWLLVVFVVIALLFFLVAKHRQLPKGGQELPYQKQAVLFTPAERSFYGVLSQAVGKDFQVFGKVRVADVLAVRRGLDNQARTRAFNQISAKHFDFILCAPGDLSVLCAIELNDASHQRNDRKDRDIFLLNACNAAGLPLINFDAKHAYVASEICARIAECISGVSAETRTEPTIAVDEPVVAATEQSCPKCSSPMIRRVAKGGNNAGQEFWGCSRFPACREILNI
ncbi:MAG: DUF2726 domain-containing protein [Rhodocyclaceae bacterium]